MRRMYMLLACAALLALILSGCGSSSPAGDTSSPANPFPSSSQQIDPPPSSQAPAASVPPAQEDPGDPLAKTAKDVVNILRDRDLARLDAHIDPERGLLFSPYAHVAADAIRYKPGELPTFKDTNKLTWGAYDGSGEPIELSFRDYFEKFVYDRDFASAPVIGVNKMNGQGNTVFNVKDIDPGAEFVEYHYPGFDDKFEGMDWESLVLVFRPIGGEYKLCAVVHAQWTI